MIKTIRCLSSCTRLWGFVCLEKFVQHFNRVHCALRTCTKKLAQTRFLSGCCDFYYHRTATVVYIFCNSWSNQPFLLKSPCLLNKDGNFLAILKHSVQKSQQDGMYNAPHDLNQLIGYPVNNLGRNFCCDSLQCLWSVWLTMKERNNVMLQCWTS